MQHPDEGTIHAWLDGALPSAEADALAVHVGECAECSAAVADARGLIAGSSRIVSSLDIVRSGQGDDCLVWRLREGAEGNAVVAIPALLDRGRELRWVPPADVPSLPLHPAFADAWPMLLARINAS